MCKVCQRPENAVIPISLRKLNTFAPLAPAAVVLPSPPRLNLSNVKPRLARDRRSSLSNKYDALATVITMIRS